MTTLYHGSIYDFKTPNYAFDLSKVSRNMDFGRGIYLSYSYEHARSNVYKRSNKGYIINMNLICSRQEKF